MIAGYKFLLYAPIIGTVALITARIILYRRTRPQRAEPSSLVEMRADLERPSFVTSSKHGITLVD